MPNRVDTGKQDPIGLLNVEGLCKRYGDVVAVGGVDFHIHQGEVVGLVGQNGAGKSTTMRMLAGLETPDRGQVMYLGRQVNPLPLFKRSRLGLCYLPQHSSIFPELTVQENLELAIEFQSGSVSELTELVKDHGLSACINQEAGLLSGGQRRRVEIVRMLLMQPKLLLLDEPFAGLDSNHLDYLSSTLRKLARSGIGILVADHNAMLLNNLCDRILKMEGGSIQMHGSSEIILNSGNVRDSP